MTTHTSPAVLHTKSGSFSTFTTVSSDGDEIQSAQTTADFITAPTRPVPAALKLAPNRHAMASATNHASNPVLDDSIDSAIDIQSAVIDEKQWQQRHETATSQKHSPRHSTRYAHDPEKAHAPPASNPFLVHRSDVASLQSRDELHAVEELQASKAVSILLFLSGPCVALSFVNMIWAILACIITLLYQPLRLCTPRLHSSKQIRHLLVPSLNVQLRSIYSATVARNSDDEISSSAVWLVIIHLLAPVLSIGLAIASWTVAMYWCLARIVGDPSGTDKRDDGVEAVLGLRRSWEQFLLHPVYR